MIEAYYGEGFSIEEFRGRFYELLRGLLEAGIPLKPGVVELLDFLADRGLPLAVATSSERRTAERHLARRACSTASPRWRRETTSNAPSRIPTSISRRRGGWAWPPNAASPSRIRTSAWKRRTPPAPWPSCRHGWPAARHRGDLHRGHAGGCADARPPRAAARLLPFHGRRAGSRAQPHDRGASTAKASASPSFASTSRCTCAGGWTRGIPVKPGVVELLDFLAEPRPAAWRRDLGQARHGREPSRQGGPARPLRGDRDTRRRRTHQAPSRRLSRGGAPAGRRARTLPRLRGFQHRPGGRARRRRHGLHGARPAAAAARNPGQVRSTSSPTCTPR